jgi:putative salt-induced outer membrane protein YdiY
MKRYTSTLTSLAIILSSVLLPLPALAEWTGGVEGSTVLQGEDNATKIRFKAANNTRPFSQHVYADWIRGENNSNAYEVGYQPKYWLGDKLYVFGDVSMLQAKSQQIDRKLAAQGGAGFQLLQTDLTQLSLEAGLTRTVTEFSDMDEKLETDIGSVSANLTHLLAEYLKLDLTADYNTGDDVVQTKLEAELSLNVIGGAIKYSYQIENIDEDDADSIERKSSSVSYSYSF